MAAIAAVASAVLAFEIVLMRTFAIESYASFGAMVISVALLGFGASGTLLTVRREWFIRHREAVLFVSAVAFIPLVLAAHLANQHVPFVPGKMIADPEHALWLLIFYVNALVPLFAASVFIGVMLVGYTEHVHRLYSADLAASGVSAFAVLLLLWVVPPQLYPLLPIIPAAIGAVLVARGRPQQLVALAVAVVTIAAAIGLGRVRFNEYKGILGTLRTKSVSGATIIAERYGPMGFLQVVESTSERTAPGLSAATPFGISPPQQHALFVDGEKVGSLARLLSAEEGRYLDWLISALPYQLQANASGARADQGTSVMAIGVAGGEDVAEAVHHGAQRILGVATNPQYVDLLEEFRTYSGNLLGRPGVEVVVADGRGVAETTQERFDLVMLRGLDASGLSVSATPGSAESYLLTVEAFEAYFRALEPGGIVAFTMRLSVPPYTAIRLIPTAAEALRRAGRDDLGRRVAFIRDTFVGLLLVKPDGFEAGDLVTMRRFSRERSFDISWIPGVRPREVNQYTALLSEHYTQVARAVLTGSGFIDGVSVTDGYLFDVTPTWDDRPYFSEVVKASTLTGLREYQRASVAAQAAPSRWSEPPGVSPAIPGPPDPARPGAAVPNLDEPPPSVPNLDDGPPVTPPDVPNLDEGPPMEPGGPAAPVTPARGSAEAAEAADAPAAPPPPTGLFELLAHLPVDLWSVVTRWVTLAQAVAFGALLILIPVVLSRRGVRTAPHKARTFVYFACLGLGFMVAEMVLIRKLTLFLASPLYATTIVLAAILLFSGLGSGYAERFGPRRTRALGVAALGIGLSVLFWVTAADPLLRVLLGLPTVVRMLVATVLIAPMAFCLGFPFPTGMAALDASERLRPLVPWAWGINGATSVVAAVLTDLGSIHFGFRAMLVCVAGIYLVAWIVFPGRDTETQGTASAT